MTEEVLAKAPFAALFATGPQDPLKNKHCFCCMFCQRNVKMASRGVSESRRHFQQDQHLRADQIYREKFFPRAVPGKNASLQV